QALTTAEVFRCLTDSIWSEYPAGSRSDVAKPTVPIIRRNLQREHVKNLSTLVLGQQSRDYDEFYLIFGGGGSNVPPDARSLARMHLKEVGKRIDVVL